jgi:2,4-dienoyl-CoA reductase-like NADH-dependent reductase (Old Yellow Enzyme family)
MAPKSLFTPLQVGTLTIKNRIGMSAMTRNRAKDTYPTELMKDYYVQRAVGGAGLIVTEMTLVTRQGYATTYLAVINNIFNRLVR